MQRGKRRQDAAQCANPQIAGERRQKTSPECPNHKTRWRANDPRASLDVGFPPRKSNRRQDRLCRLQTARKLGSAKRRLQSPKLQVLRLKLRQRSATVSFARKVVRPERRARPRGRKATDLRSFVWKIRAACL